MKKDECGLFVGRFQPFHRGHLYVVERMDKEVERIKIAVGSSQYSNTADNPFTFDERKEMITETLRGRIKHPFEIISVPDIHNYPKWVAHVTGIVGDIDVVYSGNELVERLFREKGYRVVHIDHIDDISATAVRDLMGNRKDYESLIPREIYDYLKRINAVERLNKILGE